MPKFNETLVSEGYFEIDDKAHQKGAYDLAEDPDNETLGLFRINENVIGSVHYIVAPVIYSDWTNSSDTPYASYSALITDVRASFFLTKSGGGAALQGLQSVLTEGNTSDSIDLNLTQSRVVSDRIEASGKAVFISQNIKLGGFGSVLENENTVTGTRKLGIKMPVTTAGTSDIAEVPKVGGEQVVVLQPVDTDLFTGNFLTLPDFIGTGDFVTTILQYNFQDAGKDIKIRSVTDDGIELLGTSADPFLRFTSVAGITTIPLENPIGTELGVIYNITIETEDGSPLNILGDNSGTGMSTMSGDFSAGSFNAYFAGTIQSFELKSFDMENLVDTDDFKRMTTLERASIASAEQTSNKGIANGYAPLDGSMHVPAANLPSYVDDVLEFADLASFPVTGETGKIYIALDTNLTYRWSGSVYVELTDTTAVWGNISGLLTNQTDLQSALDGKKNDFSENTAFNKNFGTSAGTVLEGNTPIPTLTDVINDAAITTSQTWSSDKINSELGDKADKDGETITNASVNGVTLSTGAFVGFYLNGVGNYVQVNANHVINSSGVAGLYVDDALDTLNASIFTPAYGELYRSTEGNQKVKSTDEVMEWDTSGLSSGTTVSTVTNSITVLEDGNYKCTIFGGVRFKRDEYCYGKIGVNGTAVATIFRLMTDTDGYFVAMSGSRTINVSTNDVITFMGFVDDGMDREFYLQEGCIFRVEKV